MIYVIILYKYNYNCMLFVFFFFGFFNAMYEMIKSCQYTDTSDQIQNNV